MLHPRFTGAFKKDRKRAARRGKDLDKLDTVMRRLANEEPLEPLVRDHKLSGACKDFRECHIEPDWLLCAMSAPKFHEKSPRDSVTACGGWRTHQFAE